MNKDLAAHVLQQFLNEGGRHVCMCAGSRNAPLVSLLAAHKEIKTYYFFEERCAAFFALGLCRRTQAPVAVVTTSGTAAGELLPAIMEAYYAGASLLAITADRPRSYRGTNAPQSCEQVGLYGHYATWEADLAAGERLDLSSWSQKGPAHINVCFTEPLQCAYTGGELMLSSEKKAWSTPSSVDLSALSSFLDTVKNPLVVVGAVHAEAREAVRNFLLQLQAPIYAEGLSGLREDTALEHLRVYRPKGLWRTAEIYGYPIDGVLRIGNIPTVRLWRDLEDLEGKVQVLSLSEQPFSGLSWGRGVFGPLDPMLRQYERPTATKIGDYASWLQAERRFQAGLEQAFMQEPLAEPSLFFDLAHKIPDGSFVYLGNSMPIRNWDQAAPYRDKHLDVWATRGLSGIDGQVSTFFGLCQPDRANWALLGDLTTLYDLAGFWIARQQKELSFTIVVINNGGGQIFSRMYPEPEFINEHGIRFKALAHMWGIEYECWEEIPTKLPQGGQRIVELVVNPAATRRLENVLADQVLCLGASRA